VKTISAQFTFEKSFRDTVSLSASSAEPLSGGGYIACGSVRGVNHYNAMLTRLGSGGNILWTTTYSSYVDLFGMDVHPVSTGGFILLAQKQQTTAFEAQVIRTDANGNVLWQQSYGGPGDEEVKEIIETSDGGFLISVQSNSYGAYVGATLIKTDSAGAVIWRKNYRGNRGAVGCSAKEVPSGGYVLTARLVDSVAGYVNDVMVVRVDVNGTIIWSTVYGSTNVEEPYDIEVTPDNGFLVAGRLYGFGAGNTDIFLSKLDSIGNLLWTKTYGGVGFELTYDIDITSDSGVIIGGWTGSSFSSTINDYYLIRTDSNGDTLWTSISNSGTNGGHFITNVAETSDGGFMCSGEAYMIINSQYVMYLVKTDASGNTDCNQHGTATIVTNITLPVTALPVNAFSGSAVVTTAITVGTSTLIDSTFCSNVGIPETASLPNSITVFPCPATTLFTVSTTDHFADAQITIFNSFGQVVGSYSNINGTSVSIDCHSLCGGIYFLTVSEDEHLPVTRSFIIAEH
jgi:hypothetical protein